jgi:hypothetical protein
MSFHRYKTEILLCAAVVAADLQILAQKQKITHLGDVLLGSRRVSYSRNVAGLSSPFALRYT